MMGDKIFLDTNVLLRLTIYQFPEYLQVKTLVATYTSENTEIYISRQIVREYLNQVTRPQNFMVSMTASQVKKQYEIFRSIFKIADETETVTQHLIDLLQKYPTGGKQIHDANIVATMLANGVDTLLTLNVADFKRFSDVITLITPLSP
jgi:predicted nucleic acid-binding protein